MIDVTKLILNFHKLLIAIAKSLTAIGLTKDSDEWEELVENAFAILVSRCLLEKYAISIVNEYEMWNQRNFKNELMVVIDVGSSLLVGKKNKLDDLQFKYEETSNNENPIKLSFIEFGNPTYTEDDIKSLDFVVGFDISGSVVCARIDKCKFFVDKN